MAVQLSSERARQAVREDCSFAKKQASPSALLVVVLSRCRAFGRPRPRSRVERQQDDAVTCQLEPKSEAAFGSRKLSQQGVCEPARSLRRPRLRRAHRRQALADEIDRPA